MKIPSTNSDFEAGGFRPPVLDRTVAPRPDVLIDLTTLTDSRHP